MSDRIPVWPNLLYTDARAAIRFLVEAFGFTERVVHLSPDGTGVTHAELDWPAGGGVMVGSFQPGHDIAPMPDTGLVYLVTDEPDAGYERAVAAGATVVRGLRDEDYGSRGFTVRDPAGVYWSFGTYAGE